MRTPVFLVYLPKQVHKQNIRTFLGPYSLTNSYLLFRRRLNFHVSILGEIANTIEAIKTFYNTFYFNFRQVHKHETYVDTS